MPKVLNLVGQKFGRLIVLRAKGKSRSGNYMWLCRCDCGKEVRIQGLNLRSGRSKSCGCLRGESAEGIHGSPEYGAFINARRRCTNPRVKQWADYGGRGIEFRFRNLAEFMKVLGPRPSPAHSLDRIDNDGHYEPGNVRWATKKEQQNNMRRNIRNR